MKSALEIPETLLREAGLAAERAGLPLNEFVVSILRERLEPVNSTSRREWPVPPPELDKQETRRIQKTIDDDFGGVDADSWG